MTALYAIVGDPVAHSLSPLIHNQWLADANLDAHYDRIHLQSQEAALDIRALAREYSGLNVTLPHKMAALAAAATISPEARAIGAANTLVREASGLWSAHNTDIDGFHDALVLAVGTKLQGSRVILIGAGGAARAAAWALTNARANLVILNRSRANAEALAQALAPNAEIADLAQLSSLADKADLIVNSASLGHAGASLPGLSPGKQRPFLDLSYGKAAAGTLSSAASSGWTPHDGLPMLVGQAAAAFCLWFGISPDTGKALAACRTAVAAR